MHLDLLKSMTACRVWVRGQAIIITSSFLFLSLDLFCGFWGAFFFYFLVPVLPKCPAFSHFDQSHLSSLWLFSSDLKTVVDCIKNMCGSTDSAYKQYNAYFGDLCNKGQYATVTVYFWEVWGYGILLPRPVVLSVCPCLCFSASLSVCLMPLLFSSNR